MTALLTLLLLGGPGQDVAGMQCDDECYAVLAAALQWTIDKAGADYSAGPSRLRVDVSSIKNREGRGQEEERRVLGQIARGMSLSVEDLSRHPTFRSCARTRDSSGCTAESELVWITAFRFSMTGPDQARAFSRIEVLGGFVRRELFLEKRQGAWEVVGVGATVVS